ncbi:hypothetical protein [Aurantiacibacter sediminis]|uniref:Uncharacterized protein n=1 Tax=Aurantiacibacter sediminis TaxID=2793064 RepID=A0ABS0N0S7_9SPHN|nr:hypothetical protein [Aurantiacibacter sediminis]MBH5321564.1 hypothetical protein [Aurantiacibacter sediminis]
MIKTATIAAADPSADRSAVTTLAGTVSAFVSLLSIVATTSVATVTMMM